MVASVAAELQRVLSMAAEVSMRNLGLIPVTRAYCLVVSPTRPSVLHLGPPRSTGVVDDAYADVLEAIREQLAGSANRG